MSGLERPQRKTMNKPISPAVQGPLDAAVGRLRALFNPSCPTGMQRELMRLMIRAGRRCAHDLAHAADEMALPLAQRPDAAKLWADRAQMWAQIFYPVGGPKDYRDELHLQIWRLEQEVVRLRALCKKHGVESGDEHATPF
jgi:hypothetical protein